MSEPTNSSNPSNLRRPRFALRGLRVPMLIIFWLAVFMGWVLQKREDRTSPGPEEVASGIDEAESRRSLREGYEKLAISRLFQGRSSTEPTKMGLDQIKFEERIFGNRCARLEGIVSL